MNISEKVFLVTGGANGIGRALSLKFLKEGSRVAVVDMSDKAIKDMQEITKDYKGKISFHQCDITDYEKVKSLPEEVIKFHGQIDGIVNNAGIIQPFIKVKDLEMSKVKKVFDVNFYGTYYMVNAFLPYLSKRPEASITNVSSMGGFLPVPGQTIYGASKAAVKLFTEGLYAELRGSNLHVTLILPGAIETNITKNSGVELNIPKDKGQPKHKMTSPHKAAEIIIGGIKKDKFRVRVGMDSKIMDYFYRLLPKQATHTIAKQMADLL
jgi:short-subunit dehydrogenase